MNILCSELYGEWEGKLDMNLFRAAYPRYPDISQIHVSTQERNYTMDLRPVMNNTPHTVLHSTPLPQVSRKKSSFLILSGPPTKAFSPPPPRLSGHRNFFFLHYKKIFFP